MLNCRRCGLTNRPYAAACAHGLRALQDEAGVKRRALDTSHVVHSVIG